MRKRIKYIVEIILFGLLFLVFFNQVFHASSANPNQVYSPYEIMFNNGGDNIAIRVILFIAFATAIAFEILLIIQLIIVPIKRTLYYISIVTLTISFVAFTICGFVLQDMKDMKFYLIEGVYAFSLLGILSFELISSKGL